MGVAGVGNPIMRIRTLVCAAGVCALTFAATTPVALAQDIVVPQASNQISSGTGAILRGLDREAGTSMDFDIEIGGEAEIGHLIATLGECRYPVENPAGEAFAWIEIRDTRADSVLFRGWMVASSPALSALDHARYDIWVLSCKTS